MPLGRVRLLQFATITDLQYMPLLEAKAHKICLPAAGASSDCALVVALFVAGARGTSCFTSECSFRGTLDMVVIVCIEL